MQEEQPASSAGNSELRFNVPTGSTFVFFAQLFPAKYHLCKILVSSLAKARFTGRKLRLRSPTQAFD